ncbi:hypothetical protein [Dysgonomonas sp.]
MKNEKRIFNSLITFSFSLFSGLLRAIALAMTGKRYNNKLFKIKFDEQDQTHNYSNAVCRLMHNGLRAGDDRKHLLSVPLLRNEILRTSG